MKRERTAALIVGLGNPGQKYALTRHNLGQMVLQAFAEKHQLSFKKERDLKGEVARGTVQGVKVTLLFPTTYMNLSGSSVGKTLRYFQIPREHLLVLSDDVAIPFKALRMRERGSSGGHNGLKDIEEVLGTQEYARLRLGVGEPTHHSLEDYVLAPFTKEELKEIPEMTAQAIDQIEGWLFPEMKEKE
ncbi:MAG: aminoacyl-tRNA hydrolase [Chlamydiia bacterium]|nr:aminoacyl-tRNA hydrolase [Chlamydiia bacterium]